MFGAKGRFGGHDMESRITERSNCCTHFHVYWRVISCEITLVYSLKRKKAMDICAVNLRANAATSWHRRISACTYWLSLLKLLKDKVGILGSAFRSPPVARQDQIPLQIREGIVSQ
jgi:hypothetical protein